MGAKRILKIFLLILAFAIGYFATEFFFKVKLLPLPFEFFGVLVGLGLASFTRAIGGLFMNKKLTLLIFLFGLFALSSQRVFADDATTNAKLDRVISNQEEIFKKLEEIKEEVQIVKVRATNR